MLALVRLMDTTELSCSTWHYSMTAHHLLLTSSANVGGGGPVTSGGGGGGGAAAEAGGAAEEKEEKKEEAEEESDEVSMIIDCCSDVLHSLLLCICEAAVTAVSGFAHGDLRHLFLGIDFYLCKASVH